MKTYCCAWKTQSPYEAKAVESRIVIGCLNWDEKNLVAKMTKKCSLAYQFYIFR
jgi:hypothetical protein